MAKSINAGVPFDSVGILRTTFVLRTIRMLSWCTRRVSGVAAKIEKKSYVRYQGHYRGWVWKPGSSLDPVNLLSLCFGYCSPLVQWDCNRCNKSSSSRPPRKKRKNMEKERTKKTRLRSILWVRAPWPDSEEAPGRSWFPNICWIKQSNTHTVQGPLWWCLCVGTSTEHPITAYCATRMRSQLLERVSGVVTLQTNKQTY